MKAKILTLPYQPGHLDSMTPKAFYGEKEVMEARLNSMYRRENVQVRTLFLGTEPIAILGAINVWQGFAEVFAITTDKINPIRKEFCQVTKALLDMIQAQMQLHRMQFTIYASEPSLRRWAKFLGFQEEGYLKAYGPRKEDHILVARVF